MSDSLLPENFDEFRSSSYWDRFFTARASKSFEWYVEWPQLKSLVLPICKGKKVLVVGCGNSDLSADMYDDGIEDIINIDFSKIVIREMMIKNLRARPKMKWRVMDMTNTKFEDGSIEVVMDKGALDALMGEENEDAERAGKKLMAEVIRVLDENDGKYICVTLAQGQVLRCLMGAFLQGWKMTIHQISPPDDMVLSPLHPFVIVAERTREKGIPRICKAYKNACYGTNAEQFEMIWRVVDAENSARETVETSFMIPSMACDFDDFHPGRRVQLGLPLAEVSPDFDAVVLDSSEEWKLLCAVFVVPQGRDNEWLYSSQDGQWQIAAQCKAKRVIIASVAPGHAVPSIAALQEELSPLVERLIPSEVRFKPKAVPYVTVSSGVGSMVVRVKANSGVSGQVIIEDVELDGQFFRRLIFGCSRSLVQSEVVLKPTVPHKGDSIPPVAELSVMHSSLPCAYHHAMVAGLSLLPQLRNFDSDEKIKDLMELETLVIGLGGGGLIMFLHKHFRITLDVIELDPIVVEMAEKWFDFEQAKNLELFLGDGVVRIRRMSTMIEFYESVDRAGLPVSINCDVELMERISGSCLSVSLKGMGAYDAIMLDAGGVDNSDGMACPHRAFLDRAFLEDTKNVLASDGILIVNFVARSKSKYREALRRIARVFPHLKEISIEEDVNRVVFAYGAGAKANIGPHLEGLKRFILKDWSEEDLCINKVLEGMKDISF